MAENDDTPREGADQMKTFIQVAAAIDEAEATYWDRPGGGTAADRASIRRLEAELPKPAAAIDWEWLARRLARALENGWTGPAAFRLIQLAK